MDDRQAFDGLESEPHPQRAGFLGRPWVAAVPCLGRESWPAQSLCHVQWAVATPRQPVIPSPAAGLWGGR